MTSGAMRTIHYNLYSFHMEIINEASDNTYILMDTDGTLNSLLPGILDEAEHVGNYNIHWDRLDTYILNK